jgi:hypothetical protein
LNRTFLASLLSFLLVFAGPASLVGFAQGAGATDPDGGSKPLSVPASEPDELTGFIIRQVNGETVCLDATPAELLRIRPLDGDMPLRQLNHLSKEETTARGSVSSDGQTTAEAATGLKIILRGTEQLNANAPAAAAFARAAAVWESIITSDITVVIDVDFGTTRFGTGFDDGVLGSTSGGVFFIPPYSDVRSRLIARASNAEELGIYNLLPASSVPTDLGATTQVAVASPLARALGAIDAHANPAPTPNPSGPGGKSIDAFGNAPSIGFNSNFTFDFNPDDGITPNTTDFVAVAVHEIGHALGFTSQVGQKELSESVPVRVSVWDLFRFRPSTGPGAFPTATRVLSSGGEHVHFDGGPELALSTGRPDGTQGDGRQSSHWKDDSFTGVFIGIMDPTLPRGRREELTNNDRRAINFFGYQVGAAPPPPANDNFDAAVELAGPSGTVTGASSNATKEANEPSHAGNRGGHSVWYRWTAPATGSATFDTVGSSFDTTLAAYTGDSVGALTPLAGSDDIQDGVIRTSRVTFNVTAGATYRIAVDGWNGDFGSVTLNWAAQGQAQFSITGRVTSACCEQSTDISGVTVTLSGTQAASAQTDAGGAYRFDNLPAGGSYVVTPSKPGGVTFSPASAIFNNLTQNQVADFTASRLVFTIGGQAKDAQGNGIAGATVVLSKQVPDSPVGIPSFKTTDAGGNFSFNGDPGGNYTVSISKPGFVFLEPRSFTFNNLSASQSVTFAARRLVISGRVTGLGGNVAGATVTLAGAKPGVTTTDAEGRYSFGDLPEGSYTLTPRKDGQFVAYQSNVNLSGDQTDFNLRLDPYIRISGRVTDGAGNPLSGAVIRLPSLSFSQAVNADGGYTVAISPWEAAPVTLVAEMPGYQFAPASVTYVNMSGGNQTANFTGTAANAIDGSQFFVAQHYRDFLGREADAGGLNFWTGGIETCGVDQQCRALKRIDTSAAFFLSIEFQETGFLAHKMYKAAYGDAVGQATINGVLTNIPVPVVRMNEFFPDTQRLGLNVVVGTAGWPDRLENNKTAFAQEFVSRPRFTTAFPSNMTPTAFVDALNANAGNVLSAEERAALVSELTSNNGVAGRASVLRKVAEDADLTAAEKNRAFVLMQYFGYMRRNPNDLPDTNHSGYNFWLKKLNDNGGDYHKAQMVFAFLDSIEYRNRFQQ